MIHPTDTLRLVPVEPTAKMAQAARDAIHTAQTQGWAGLDPIDIYRAMLASAPESPLPEGGGPTCQVCGSKIEAWTCQGCGAQFHENDAGSLVLGVPAAPTGDVK